MKKKKGKIARYLTVYGKRLRRLKRKNIGRWFANNLKGHPFILGILILFWASTIIRVFVERMAPIELLKFILKLHGGLFLVWLVLAVLSNLLKDKDKVRWFFKKRFVFTLLILFSPVGIIFLWSGSHFKRVTKTILTIAFAIFFIASQVYSQKKFFRLVRMTTFERIIEEMKKQKNKTYLKPFSGAHMLDSVVLARITEKARVKLAVSDVYTRNALSIASIITKDASGKEIGRGSGFVISSDGIIVTNLHVLGGAYQAEVRVGKQVFKQIFLLKGIPAFDIALLKVNAEGLLPAYIGDSDRLVSGQFVVALGDPLGLEQSVSTGVISAVRSSGQIKLIQTTAPLSPGSSGGPLLNEHGEVIGITTLASFFLAQNVNFAIPINYLAQSLEKE